MNAECGARDANGIACRASAVGGCQVMSACLVCPAGPRGGVGQLDDNVHGRRYAGGLDDLESAQVVPAGVVMTEPRGGLAGGEDGVVHGIAAALWARSEQVGGDSRGVARLFLEGPAEREFELGSGRGTDAAEDRLPVEVVCEPRLCRSHLTQRRPGGLPPAA